MSEHAEDYASRVARLYLERMERHSRIPHTDDPERAYREYLAELWKKERASE